MSDSQPQVLIIDDEPSFCSEMESALTPCGVRCTFAGTTQDGGSLAGQCYDVVVLDLFDPGPNGLDLLGRALQVNPQARVVCVTDKAFTDSGALVRRTVACAVFQKPAELGALARCVARNAFEAARERPSRRPNRAPAAGPQAHAPIRLAGSAGEAGTASAHAPDESRRMLLEFAGALVQTVEAKDPYTRRHSEHVVHYVEGISDFAGMPEGLRDTLSLAVLLHDIGKIAVPDSVLTKPAGLTRQEFDFVRQHPSTGADILQNISLMSTEAEVVRQHHERWDGTGYPHALSGETISLGGRLLNIADSIDAMLMHRTYKDSYPVERMLGELRSCAGTQFDPDLAQVAVQWCEQNPAGLIRPDRPAAA